MPVNIGFWDIMLVAAVSLQATVLAYLYHPKWKAFMLTLPVPFTIASLAVGRPIDATNVLGLTLLLIFTHSVRLLHQEYRVPIVLSIGLSALGYCMMGWGMAGILPAGEVTFWISGVGTLVMAVILLKIFAHREEQGYRSSLPVWIKLPIIVAIVCFLIIIKKGLHGFMTVFPMVGVIGAYEARNSLWTISRQIPVVMLTMIPMMMTCRLTQDHLGLGASLILGWLVFIVALIPITWFMWSGSAQQNLIKEQECH